MLLPRSLDVLVGGGGIAIHRSFTRGGSTLRSKHSGGREALRNVTGLAEKMIYKLWYK